MINVSSSKKIHSLVVPILVVVALMATVLVGSAAENTIKIGCFYPLTGANAAKGQLNKNGTDLAVKDINAAGGVLGMKIELVYEDTQSNKVNVPNVVRKLIEQDKVVALLGEIASSNSIAAGPVLMELKRPAIAPTSTNPNVVMDPNDTTKLNPWYFRACFIDSVQGTVMANFVYNTLKKTKVALLYNIAQDYSKGLAQFFKERFTKLGGTIIGEETFPDLTQDFKPQLTKIKGMKPEAIIGPNTYDANGLILRQMLELGMSNIPFMGADSTHAPKIIEIAGQDALKNLYFTTLYVDDDPDPKAQAFAKKYRDEFKSEPNSNACFSYEAMIVLAEAIKVAKGTSPEALRTAIENIKNIQVPSGSFTMDPKTHNPLNKPVIVAKVKGEGFTFVEKVNP
ncbi:MAG TPA: ABC transporter substrate-binding protein [Bacillota bacterium]|nr:ABC transporter substrate-binding protein [Bacillota bacterium]HOH09586.1 ABC transporter substrate-binding protein [Bacillota bacterium]HOS50245.1 ABC transporter substrate-binding protein [Bacillota bacterium]HOY88386.1 ABC transporter substrate-binding protein [Bacillota bacterium]HPI00869.1 ABC transporter substrate-binding protein [Bacillota bacterium]